MKQTKRNEIPKEYRKDYKKIFTEYLKTFGLCLIFVFSLYILFHFF